jgi:hypothetical protein
MDTAAHLENPTIESEPTNWRQDRIIALVCCFVLVGILTAGLWPFHAPANRVTWTKNGLRLRFHSSLWSTEAFQNPASASASGHSIEISLMPERLEDNSSTILAFYNPRTSSQFSLHQSKDDLALQTNLERLSQIRDPARLCYLPHVFRAKIPRLITITSGPQGTAAFVDGALMKVFPSFRPSGDAFTGRLVLGNSPVVNNSWSGVFLGLAIYNRELGLTEVRQHYQSWTAKGQPDTGDDKNRTALYLFNEHGGSIVHNRGTSGIDLLIPERYRILDEKFLEPVWSEFRWDWDYWKNVLINIGGFVPLGFFFSAWFTARRTSAPIVVTILLGAAVSLTIEVLQAFLPTRDSGTTDLITNTLGTVFGVMCYRWKPTLINQTLDILLGSRLRSH